MPMKRSKMKKMIEVPSNWLLFDDDIFYTDESIQFIISFETEVMRKYFDISEYKVVVDVTDIDFVVSSEHEDKLNKMFQDEQVTLGEELKTRETGRYEGEYMFFPRNEIGDYEILNS